MDRTALLARGAREVGAGAFAEAERVYRAMLEQAPEDGEALSNLGAVLNLTGRHAAAEAACRAALAVQPGAWAAHGNLGTALHRQSRHGEALSAYVAALRANPGDAHAATNLGVALAELGRMTEALALHDHAVSLAPDDPDIRCNRAIARLGAGDLAEGFAEFEWRWRCPAMRPHGIDLPQWLGEDPAGRTILLHAEGGFGDTLQFVRYAPLLAARGARVVVMVQPALVRLLRMSLPGLTVLPDSFDRPPADLQCPLLSLPHAFGTTLETVPGRTPYLAPCPEQRDAWAARLAPLARGRPRVGVVWAGAPRADMAEFAAMNRRRSLPPDLLSPLADRRDLFLVSLQHGSPEGAPAGLGLFDAMAEMPDFAATAALVVNLDLVISVDTAVAHLAGGLGVPVWLLSRFDGCWRWLAGRRDNPWYPGLVVHRQPRPGDWASVIGAVIEDLERDTPRRPDRMTNHL